MAARGRPAAPGTVVERLPCACPRQGVVDAGQHRPTCKAAKYPTGCGSLDCLGECLVTDKHCDGDDDECTVVRI